MLQRTNNRLYDRYVIIGCGSLGAQMAYHLVKDILIKVKKLISQNAISFPISIELYDADEVSEGNLETLWYATEDNIGINKALLLKNELARLIGSKKIGRYIEIRANRKMFEEQELEHFQLEEEKTYFIEGRDVSDNLMEKIYRINKKGNDISAISFGYDGNKFKIFPIRELNDMWVNSGISVNYNEPRSSTSPVISGGYYWELLKRENEILRKIYFLFKNIHNMELEKEFVYEEFYRKINLVENEIFYFNSTDGFGIKFNDLELGATIIKEQEINEYLIQEEIQEVDEIPF